MESEVKKSVMLQYVSYLKDQFELVESYFDMIQKTSSNKKLELNHIQNKIEFVKQKIFNESELEFNPNTYKDNYDCSIGHYFHCCTNEIEYIINYIENNFKIKTVKL
jgi:hypothetical protein